MSTIAADTADEINKFAILTTSGSVSIKSRSGWNDNNNL